MGRDYIKSVLSILISISILQVIKIYSTITQWKVVKEKLDEMVPKRIRKSSNNGEMWVKLFCFFEHVKGRKKKKITCFSTCH